MNCKDFTEAKVAECMGGCHEHTMTIPEHSHSIPRSSGRYPWGANMDPTDLENAPPMRPIEVFEEECKKIHIFRVPGFNKDNLDVKENWNNKEKALKIDVYGSQYVGRDYKHVNISLYLDHEIYDKYEVRIMDGLCYIIFHEILHESPPIMRLGLEEA